MLELDQRVIVITEKKIVYDGFIMARASAENGAGAYKVGLEGAGLHQAGQWHKAADVFVPEPTTR